MPPMERKYVKQNLTRALGHCDDIIGYLVAVGMAFTEIGNEIHKAGNDWPDEYVVIIDACNTLAEGMTLMRESIEQMRDNI